MSDNLSRLLDLARTLQERTPAGMISPQVSTCRYAAEELEMSRALLLKLREELSDAREVLGREALANSKLGIQLHAANNEIMALCGERDALKEECKRWREEVMKSHEAHRMSHAAYNRMLDKAAELERRLAGEI